jgi:t-SNARE complex subunit (syntaxin)
LQLQYALSLEQKSLAKNKGLIPVTHDTDANDLKTQVAENEKQWRKLKRRKIPVLQEAARTKAAALQQALGNLSLSWTEDAGENGDGVTGGFREALDAVARAFSG